MRTSIASPVAAVVLSLLITGAGIGSTASAAASDAAGKWLGIIHAPGMELRMAFEITGTREGGYSALVHSIDQGAMNIKMTSVTVRGDSVRLELKGAFAYEGKLSADGSSIDGNWVQGGLTPLPMKRVDVIPELPRPQNPKKPYPYREIEVTYPNRQAGVTIAGTFTIPEGTGPFPAVLLIGGSGQADRNESVQGHRLFLVLADQLTRAGIAVLRYDKRGVGETTGTFRGSGLPEFSADALAGVTYLRSRPEIDPKRIGLIGHSEGGETASMAAAGNPEIAFVVFLASPGISNYDILVLQDGTEAKVAGKSDAEVELIRGFSRRYYTIVMNAKDSAEIDRATKALYAVLTDEEKKALDWPNLRGTMALSWGMSSGEGKWLAYDVQPYLRKVACPVLAINGSKDCQVPPKENLGGIERALTEGGNRTVTIRELPGLNHLFQTCGTGATSEYIKIEETMSPLALGTVTDWIGKQTVTGREHQ
jgi:uncharacterized protein